MQIFMVIKNKQLLVTVIIMILAVFLRAYHLDTYPPVNADEAALGYNAYSLLQTGKDEHGASWPLHFQSFGDYKPGGYIYLLLPFVKILGLNSLALRLPNLLLSILCIYLVGQISRLILKNDYAQYFSMLFMAISPWHIIFSRGAWESSFAFSLFILGLYLFLKKQKIVITAIFWALSLYFYHSARVFLPLFLLSLLISNIKDKIEFKRVLLIGVLVALLSLPAFVSFLKNSGTARFNGVGIFADLGPKNRAEELLNQDANTKLINRITHNYRLLYLFSFVDKYLSHFNLNFLFIEGDSVPRSKLPDLGQTSLFFFPLFLLGLFALTKLDSKTKILMLILLFTSPIASALTFQAPSALRSLYLLLPLTLILTLGSLQLLKYKRTFLTLFTIATLFSTTQLIYSYFYRYPRELSLAWPYRFQEVVNYLKTNNSNNLPVYFTNTYDQPYILYLYYSQYPPSRAQTQTKLTTPDQFGFSTVEKIDNITFEIPKYTDIASNSTIVASNEVIPILPKLTFNFANGQNAFKIYQKP